MERVFDICHGCRRCVSLCHSFPTLFDLVDESKTMEVDGVAKEDYWKVVDQCYLCDVCYMTKCPYTPPHPWNLDFPHLMLRAKAVKFRQEGARFRDRPADQHRPPGQARDDSRSSCRSSTRSTRCRRAQGDGQGARRRGRAAAAAVRPKRFRKTAKPSIAWPVRNGERTPGKVAIFSTCYINYNEPGIGHDLVRILEHNEIPYRIAEKEACCGMPKLELGDFESVERLKNINIPALAALARDGHAILTSVPSCTLMFKQELPLLFPGDDGREGRSPRRCSIPSSTWCCATRTGC